MDEELIADELHREPTRCPRCGAAGIPIVYGVPDSEVFARIERGDLVLGGCGPDLDLPGRFCRVCDRAFGSFDDD